MTDPPGDSFDLDRLIASRLGDQAATDLDLQALAVLIDAELTDSQRAEAIGSLLETQLDRLTGEEVARFIAP